MDNLSQTTDAISDVLESVRHIVFVSCRRTFTPNLLYPLLYFRRWDPRCGRSGVRPYGGHTMMKNVAKLGASLALPP